jgi:TatD DNase family protein
MIIDTHCHYNVEPIFSEAQKHWENSLNAGVVGAICIGTDIENSKTALNLTQKFDGMFAAIGIHPEEYTNFIKSQTFEDQDSIGEKIAQDINEFEKLLKETQKQDSSKLVAIGEIGLDYYRLKSKGLKRELAVTMQKQIFSKQLALAFQYELPVILHVRDQADRKINNAYFDTLEIVKETLQASLQDKMNIPPIILHCSSGPREYIKSFLDLGAYMGVGGNVTYDNASELREIFKITPKNRVLLETDSPYLAPNEKKGQICEPKFIVDTAKFLQNTYQLDLDIIITNTLKVFPQFKK